MSKDKIDVIYRMLSEGSSPIDVIKHFRLLRDDPNIPGKHKGVSNRTVYQVAERMKNGESISHRFFLDQTIHFFFLFFQKKFLFSSNN